MADLKTLLGDDYKDGISVEEIAKALENKSFIDKKAFDKTASELSELKKEKKKLEEAGMSAEEKVKAAVEAAAAKEREYSIKSNRIEVEKIFLKGGLAENDYSNFLDDVVSENLEKSKAVATAIADTIQAKIKAAEQAVKAELLKNTPTPPPGDGGTAMTKEKFDKMTTKEQMEYIKNNPNWKEQIKT